MENYLQHEQKIIVTVNDTDFLGQIKPSAIMGYFQDIAVEHAEKIGVGYDVMRDKNMGWVLIRMSYRIIRNPLIGESLTIKTFPEKPRTADANRGYYIYDKNNNLIILGSSKWCVIDLSTHRLQKCVPLFTRYDDSLFIPSQPFEGANPKLAEFTSLLENPINFKVNVTDLDRYLHMNNARYGDVVLNTCGAEMLKNNWISSFDANFMSQLFISDIYTAYKEHNGNTTNIEVRKEENNIIAFRAQIVWTPRSI